MVNETERSKTKRKKLKKKNLPGFFLFENLLYLKCKITSQFLIHFSPFFLVASIPSCQGGVSWFVISLPVPHFNFSPPAL